MNKCNIKRCNKKASYSVQISVNGVNQDLTYICETHLKETRERAEIGVKHYATLGYDACVSIDKLFEKKVIE